MKVKIGRDFYDKKNDRIYASGDIETVNKEVAKWIVRNNLGHIIPNVRVGRPVKINNKKSEKRKAIEESEKEDRMVRTTKNK
jgi:hypothetical protein